MIKKIYEKTKESLRTADRLTMVFACIVLVFTLTMINVHAADAAGDEANTNLGGVEINIAHFSGIATDAFNNMMSSTLGTGKKDNTAKLLAVIDNLGGDYAKLGNIGNFLGIDSINDDADNASNVFGYGTTGQTKTLDIQTIAGWYTDETAYSNSAMASYILFGSALHDLGIDEIRNASGTSDGTRMIIGYVTYVCYILAYSASTIMTSVIEILQKINIFAYIWEGTGTLFETWRGQSDFVDTIMNIYDDLKPFRWVILGWILILFIASITVWKSKQMNQAATTQTRGRKIVLRLIIMCIGVPLAGMVYTECLNIVQAGFTGNGGIESTKKSVTDYVFSGFLDFETWTVGQSTSESFKVNLSSAESGLGFNPNQFVAIYDQSELDVEVLDSNGKPLDASKFTYAINESIWSKDVTGFAKTGNYVSDVWKEGASYSDILETQGEQSADLEKSYVKARDMLLSYAQGDTINADVLNMYYVDAYNYSATAADEILKGEIDDANERASMVATVMEQLYGVNSADQRIWSFAQVPGDDWIYKDEANGKDNKLSEVADAEVIVNLTGVPLLPTSTSGAKMSTFDLMRKVLVPVKAGYVNWGENAGDLELQLSYTTYIQATPGARVTIGDKNYETDITPGEVSFICAYDLSDGGMSALSMYNYLHTSFERGGIEIYPPQSTSNEGVSLQHYSVTTPYTGIPELVNLLYTICIMFSIGIIGWVFGISLLMNTLVQTVKAIPIVFKMMVGSIQGFVEGLLTVFSICVELLITITLYVWSVDIIDFVILFVKTIIQAILTAMGAIDSETQAILSGLISMLIILWATFELIKWRRAITMSIKSLLTHVLNQLFGTSAQMPQGASSGMLTTAAGLAAGAMVAGSLAESGTLDDVVNDLSGSDLGTSIGEKLEDGDYSGALQDVKDYAGGTYRGRSETADAEAALGENNSNIGDANAVQSMTDEQNAELAAMDEEIAQAEEEGRIEDAENLRAEKAAKQSQYAHQNYAAATSLGVVDYGDHLRQEKAKSDTNTRGDGGGGEDAAAPVEVEPANIPEEPSTTLDANGNMAYDAARTGDVESLRTAADTYDRNGLTESQAEDVSQMVVNGASEEEVAAAIDGYAQQNFGDNAQAVIDKINEASGRSGGEVYGSSDNSTGNARQVTVNVTETSSGSGYGYAVTGENGTQQIEVQQAGGAANYINTTAGGASAGHIVQTVDMGQAGNNAMSYGQIYNSTSQMIVANGGNVQGGFGGAGVVTNSEMAAQISINQMSGAGITSQAPGYGNTSMQQVQTTINQYSPAIQPVNTAPAQSGGDGGDGFNMTDMMKFKMLTKAVETVTDSFSGGNDQPT